jgi:hypothetical protein
MPTYTHIVHKPDAQVQHNFSASGWEYKARHAANHEPYADKSPVGAVVKRGRKSFVRRIPYDGRYYNFSTLCGKHISMDPDDGDGDRAQKAMDVDVDSRYITCNACRRKLGLKPIPKRGRF